MKLTSKGRHTIVALMDLASNYTGSPVRLKEISDRQTLSLHYLEQLFRKLRTSGVVNSHRGPGGGYSLAKEASALTVRAILDAVGESTNYNDQLKGEGTTLESKIMSEYFGKRVEDAVQTLLSTDTLADLIALKKE